jgi:Xaa-Pro aminopeptidase
MTEMRERVHTPVSDAELERRWAAVRAAMEERGIDVLVAQNANDHMGGYVKYLTDVPATNGYPLTVVFPREDAMSVVTHGPLGQDLAIGAGAGGDGLWRGVGRVLTTASFASAPYTRAYDADLAARPLADFAGATIGLVGTYAMSFAFVDQLSRALPRATFAEASELVDRIKALKSEEEKGLIRRTAALQDAAMEAAFASVEPGGRDSDIAAVAQHRSQELGSEQGIYLCASAPPGEPAWILPRHQQHRVMREGDVLMLLIENNGPGGHYAELGRTCVLGPAPQRLLEEHAFTVRAQEHCLGLLRPGAPAAGVWEAYNAFMREHGRPEERRLHCHGQGYDLVERPLVRFDETMAIEADLNIVCHPTYVQDGTPSWVCDNVLIGPDGVAERLHAFPKEIVELG